MMTKNKVKTNYLEELLISKTQSQNSSQTKKSNQKFTTLGTPKAEPTIQNLIISENMIIKYQVIEKELEKEDRISRHKQHMINQKMIDDEKIRNLRKANYQNFVNSINDTTVRRSATQIILRKNISKFVNDHITIIDTKTGNMKNCILNKKGNI